MLRTKLLLSGIQATNSLTLGNYLGALKNLVDLQADNKMILFIADLHSLTSNFDPVALAKNRLENALLYAACGIDFEKTIVFFQSDIAEHSELFYLLSVHSYIGELSRMTQFKDKSNAYKLANKTVNVKTGLLIYPCLMAADILLYDPDYVIVGNDQKQHLELTKTLAKRINHQYQKDIFKIPEIYLNKVGSRIMDLTDSSIKMSKSNKSHKGVVFLLEELDSVRKKILSAKTDSVNEVKYDLVNQKEVANLLTIYSLLSKLEIKDIEKKYTNRNYLEFKTDLANIVCEELSKIQTRYNQLKSNNNLIDLINKNTESARIIAKKKVNLFKQTLGLVSY